MKKLSCSSLFSFVLLKKFKDKIHIIESLLSVFQSFKNSFVWDLITNPTHLILRTSEEKYIRLFCFLSCFFLLLSHANKASAKDAETKKNGWKRFLKNSSKSNGGKSPLLPLKNNILKVFFILEFLFLIGDISPHFQDGNNYKCYLRILESVHERKIKKQIRENRWKQTICAIFTLQLTVLWTKA